MFWKKRERKPAERNLKGCGAAKKKVERKGFFNFEFVNQQDMQAYPLDSLGGKLWLNRF
jgi:hypothetical protein